MIQFIAAAAVGGVALYAYSSFKKHMADIEAKEKLEEVKPPKQVGDLEHDPDTGKYRPRK